MHAPQLDHCRDQLQEASDRANQEETEFVVGCTSGNNSYIGVLSYFQYDGSIRVVSGPATGVSPSISSCLNGISFIQ